VSESLDVAAIRADFPILSETIHDHRLVFLDSAASSQRPRAVIDAVEHYVTTSHSNVHRAAYTLAERATLAMESARRRVARFVGAADADEVVFTKNATESLNLVARSWGTANLGPGDVVVLSVAEHHANIVPWLQLV
jgi:cysteine desulfurase/selenocysteine lyase